MHRKDLYPWEPGRSEYVRLWFSKANTGIYTQLVKL